MGYGFRTMDDLDLAVDDASRAMSLTFEKCPGDVLHLALPEEKVDFRGTDAQAENLQALWEARLREEREAGLKACCEKLRGPLTTGVLEAILATICIFMEDPVRYKFLNIVQPVVVCMQMFPGNPRIQVPSCQILLSLTSNGSLSNEHEEAIQKFSKCCGISPLVQAMKDLPCHLSNEALRVGCSQDFSSTFLQLSLMFWPWAAGDQPSKGLLRLHVHCDSTRPGEDLGVCGDAPLPGWRGVKPLSMICQDPVTGETYWPVWKLAEPLEVSVGQELHYKYLLIRGTRRDKFKWEADGIGNHRRLRVTEEMLRAGSWDDGLFGDLPGGCPRPKKKRDEREDREAKQERKEDEEDEMCEVPKALSLPKHERIRQVGKGKQGACFLVDLDGEKAVLKEIKGGGRQAFRAELWALQQLQDTEAVQRGAIPAFLGADREKRRVMMSYFAGVKLPDAGLAPVLSSRSDANVSTSTTSTLRALRCWLHVASAVEEANRTGVYHCDVNPWNVLIAEDDGAASQGCLVDWACSSASKAPKLHRRGDFQAAELLEGSVGPHTDVYGCASTLLWLLLKRTRKGLVEHERSRERLLEHFRETGAVEAVPALDPLAACCAWGMAEDVKERCPTLAPLLELVKNATQQMEKTTRAVRLLPS
eukprot:s435_g2.t2